MKKLLLSIALFTALTASAQTVKQLPSGNYIAVKATGGPATNTGKTFTDNKGQVYPVYTSARGKLFIMKTSKAGNQYKSYLKIN